jgi:coniferyl-aldehyde dehydrogenase
MEFKKVRGRITSMNSSANPMDGAALRVKKVFAAQRAAFEVDPYPLAARRRASIKALKRQVSRYQDVLADAMSRDFGFRAPTESKMLDLLGSTLEANHAIAHLKRWMKPSRRTTELLFLSNSLSVTYQPKGVVGVIVPWNFPIYLAVGPLIAALAAGNRVMIKMSEITPATNAALTRLLSEIFEENEVAVVGEELTDPNVFTALPFNHIVFTGSPGIGKIVMRAAAEKSDASDLGARWKIASGCLSRLSPSRRRQAGHPRQNHQLWPDLCLTRLRIGASRARWRFHH